MELLFVGLMIGFVLGITYSSPLFARLAIDKLNEDDLVKELKRRRVERALKIAAEDQVDAELRVPRPPPPAPMSGGRKE